MKRLKSLLTGLALGGLIGILFAPKKGSDLRENLKRDIEEGNYGVNALKDAFVGMGKDMKGFSKEVSKQKDIQEYLTKGKKTAGDVKERAMSWLEENYGITESELKKAQKDVFGRAKKAKKIVGKTLSKAVSAARKAANRMRNEE